MTGRPRWNVGRPTMRRDWAGEGPPAKKSSVAGPCREVWAPTGRPAFRLRAGSRQGGRLRLFRHAARGTFSPKRSLPRPPRSPENGAAALPGPGSRLTRTLGHFRYPGLCGFALPSGPPSPCPARPPAQHATSSTTWLVGKLGPFQRMSGGRPLDVLKRPAGFIQPFPSPPPPTAEGVLRHLIALGLSQRRPGGAFFTRPPDGVAEAGSRLPPCIPRRAPSLSRRARKTPSVRGGRPPGKRRWAPRSENRAPRLPSVLERLRRPRLPCCHRFFRQPRHGKAIITFTGGHGPAASTARGPRKRHSSPQLQGNGSREGDGAAPRQSVAGEPRG